MERLTIKLGNTYKYNFNTNCDFEERDERSIETHNKIVNKLGMLEDIEEELGISLIVLFKALKDGTNFSSPNETVMGIPFAHIVHSPHLVYDFFGQKWVLRERGGYERKVKDFGITWSLLEGD